MALVALAPLLLGGLFWAMGEYRSAQSEADGLRKRFIENRKQLLVAEVGSVIKYIKSARERLERQCREELATRVDQAIQMAESMYRKYRGRKTPDEIKTMIRDALGAVRFDNGLGYYFAVNLEGGEELYPGDRGRRRTWLDIRDGSGRPIVRDIIELAKARGRGFYRYFWKKTGDGKDYFPKIAHVKLFKPYGWVIGTARNLDDIQAEIQSRVLSNVAEMRFGTEGYYFACDYKGNPMFSNGKITRGGKNILGVTDPNGVRVIQSQIKAAQKPGGGFYYYSWPKLDKPGPFPKMSFVMGFAPWQWAVGAGVYLDTIEKEIANRERGLWSRLASRAVEGSLLMILFLMLTYLWAGRIARRIKQSLKAFSGFFRKAGGESVQIDLEKVHYQEFKDMARWANQMVADRKKQETEKELLEAQLRQSQKMEAIGTLAGGIAHDFNNILAAIMGYAELSLEDSREGKVNQQFLENILEASIRAKELVRGILAFSRSTAASYYTLDLNQEVRAAVNILGRTLPRRIRLEMDLDPDLGPILGDSGQIQQVLLNLVSNSNDAMPDGGLIRLETGSVPADRINLPPNEKTGPKDFAVLKVKDSGTGIPGEIMEQVFDPFFTTKEVGKGTGLGLSTAYGIVKSHMGHIECRSEPGEGTEFTIYFPVTSKYLPPPEEVWPEAPPEPGGQEVLLLVDDEQAIREIGSKLLEAAGYRTLTAVCGEEALEIYQKEKVDLVLLDLDMPGMGGRECMARLFEMDREAKVVVASGHALAQDEIPDGSKGIINYVAKPYRRVELLRAVRNALDGKAG